MDKVLILERNEAIKKIAGFHDNLSKRMHYRPESLIGTKEECKEMCMNLLTIKNLLKDSKSQTVCIFVDELDILTLAKKYLKMYFPGGKKYWEEFLYLR